MRLSVKYKEDKMEDSLEQQVPINLDDNLAVKAFLIKLTKEIVALKEELRQIVLK